MLNTYVSRGSTFYFRFFRMSPQRFAHLFSLVGPRLKKNDIIFRKAIPPGERLAFSI